MAIKLPDGRIMRTLPEQVDKNMQDIASINNEVNVIKESITTAYKIQGSATVAELNANTPDAAMNGYVYNMTDAGSLINSDESTTSVQIGDNVVLVWNEGNYFWDRLSGVVDTSNLVTLDSNQDITGVKSIANGIYLRFYAVNTNSYFYITGNGNQFYIGAVGVATQLKVGRYFTSFSPEDNGSQSIGDSTHTWKDLYLSGRFYLGTDKYIYLDSSNRIVISNNADRLKIGNDGTVSLVANFIPLINNSYDLGSSSQFWRNIYLAGNISDGTNSVTVAEIIKKRLTVQYTVSAAASTGISMINLTLSADDLAKLDSTKPLIIANNSTSAAVISAVYLPTFNLFSVLAYQTQGNTSLNFDIYQ